MMQVIKVIVVIFLLGGCKTPDIITVKLETAKENDGLLGSSQVGLNKESKDIDTYQKFAKQYKLDTFLVFSYSHSPEEYYYNQYLSGEISLDFFSKIINLYNIDTLKVRYTQYDAQSLILLGLKKNGDCVIVADENNNNDFYDDSFHTIENWFNENRKLSPDSLPYVTINNLISNYNNKKTIFSTSYYIKPLKRDSSMMLNHKPISEINISLISDEYLYGKFKLKGTKYRIAARNLNLKYVYDNKNTIIEIGKKKKFFQFYRTHDINKLNHIGDLVNLRKSAIEFSSISIDGREITLKVVPKIEGQNIIKDFAFKDFVKQDTSRFQEILNRYNYVIADFWGSWCVPCIRSFPELKELNTELASKGIGFVGFIYDQLKNKSKIDSLLNAYKIDWPQMLLEEAEKNTIREKHNVLSYPTYFLIDKAGKILYREIGIDGLKKIKQFMIKNRMI